MTNIIQTIEAPASKEKFVQLFQAVHKVQAKDAESMYAIESFHFKNLLEEKDLADKVTAASALGVFLDVVSNGLSFSPQSQNVYIQSRSVKTGRKENGKDVYEARLAFTTQPNGKVFQAQRAGSISRVTKPVIVFEGDEFAQVMGDEGVMKIIHKPKLPRESSKIIAGYVYVVFPDGSREPTVLSYNEVERLKKYSEKNNARWNNDTKKREPGPANALYTSGIDGQIDEGFFGAKIINAALKNVRKAIVPSIHEVHDVTEEMPPQAQIAERSEGQDSEIPSSF